MITSMMGRMAGAEKLSIPQLQMAIKDGTIPAYIGVPMLQDKMKQHQQAMAAQQGQQQQAPIADQVMQEAGQYRGIDELRTNLPTEEDAQTVDDEYANGGIIAFADEGQVKEPNKSFWDIVDPNKYQADPAYKAFADSPDITDKTYKNYLEMGNTPPLTKDELQTMRHKNAFAFEDSWLNSPEGKRASIQSQQMGEPELTLPSKVNERYWTEATGDPKRGTEMAEYVSGLREGDLARMRAEPQPTPPLSAKAPFVGGTTNPETGAYTGYRRQQGNLSATPPDLSGRERELIPKQDVNLAELNTPYTPAVTPKRISEAEAARAEMLKAEAASPMGVAALPNAQNVQIAPDKQGAGAGAGGAGGAGAGALPPTLAAAEKSNSPVATQAVSMLDEFIADLKKSGQDVSRDKKEAFYMALIKGGLGAAGGTSPNALANIAAGAIPAIEGYSKDIAGIRKDERARLEKLVAAGVSKEKIGLEAKKLGITEKHYDDWYKTKVAELGVMSGNRADARAQAEQKAFAEQANGIFGKLLTAKARELGTSIDGISEDVYSQLHDTALNLATRASGRTTPVIPSAAPKSNVMGSYIPGKGYVPAGK